MRSALLVGSLLLVGALGLVAGAAFSEDDPPMGEQELWAWMMEKGQPGERHQALAALCGTWDVDATFYMESGEMKSKGRATHAMVLGGRFLKMDYAGDMGGATFEGTGYLGFNNVRGEYESFWIDGMASHFSVMRGAPGEAAGTVTVLGEWQGPGTMRLPQKWVWTLPVEGKARLQMYSRRSAEGEWLLEMDLKYSAK